MKFLSFHVLLVYLVIYQKSLVVGCNGSRYDCEFTTQSANCDCCRPGSECESPCHIKSTTPSVKTTAKPIVTTTTPKSSTGKPSIHETNVAIDLVNDIETTNDVKAPIGISLINKNVMIHLSSIIKKENTCGERKCVTTTTLQPPTTTRRPTTLPSITTRRPTTLPPTTTRRTITLPTTTRKSTTLPPTTSRPVGPRVIEEVSEESTDSPDGSFPFPFGPQQPPPRQPFYISSSPQYNQWHNLVYDQGRGTPYNYLQGFGYGWPYDQLQRNGYGQTVLEPYNQLEGAGYGQWQGTPHNQLGGWQYFTPLISPYNQIQRPFYNALLKS